MRPLLRVPALLVALGLAAFSVSSPAANVLVWDNDQGRTTCDPNLPGCVTIGSEQGVVKALLANGITPQIVTILPPSLTAYEAVFVCLGWRLGPDPAGQITSAEDLLLHDFVHTGRAVYLEGNDYARDHTGALLLTDFGARFNNDGNPSTTGTVDSLFGFDTSYASGLVYDFPEGSPEDNFPDDVLPCISPCVPGVLLFDDQNGPGKGVSYPSESGHPAGYLLGRGATSYLTVSLAGFIDGRTSTRAEFMRRTLQYFGIGATATNGTTWGQIKSLYR